MTTEGLTTRINALADAIVNDQRMLAAAIDRGAREQAHRLVDLLIDGGERLDALKAERFQQM